MTPSELLGLLSEPLWGYSPWERTPYGAISTHAESKATVWVEPVHRGGHYYGTLNVSGVRDDIRISIRCPADRLDQALDVVEDMLNPRYT